MAGCVRWDNPVALLGVTYLSGFCQRFFLSFVKTIFVYICVIVATFDVAPISVDALILDLPHLLLLGFHQNVALG